MPVRFLLALCALLSCQWAQAQDEGELLFPGFGDGAGIDDLLDELDALVDDLAGPQVTAERSWITQPYRLDLTAGGDTTSPAGCPGFFGSSTQLSINYQPIAGVSELQIIAESADDTTLWVMVNGTEHRCDDDSYGNANPIVTLAASELGNGALIGVRVGTYDSGYADARLSVRAEASSSPSPGR